MDQAYVLASASFDRHLTYVAMTRQREAVQLVYSRDTFPSADSLKTTLGRERAKDTTVDYDGIEIMSNRPPVTAGTPIRPSVNKRAEQLARELEEYRRHNRERSRTRGPTPF